MKQDDQNNNKKKQTKYWEIGEEDKLEKKHEF